MRKQKYSRLLELTEAQAKALEIGLGKLECLEVMEWRKAGEPGYFSKDTQRGISLIISALEYGNALRKRMPKSTVIFNSRGARLQEATR